MRLIDADALIESMGLENAVKWGNKDGYQQDNSYSTLMRYEIKGDIDSQPTVDAVPVVHGKWIPDTAFGNDIMSNDMAVFCSECGNGHFVGKTNYCPHCGAKMIGDDE